jgi:hypothetical protein
MPPTLRLCRRCPRTAAYRFRTGRGRPSQNARDAASKSTELPALRYRDHDTLSDLDESNYGTNPNNQDTDGDG